MSDVEALLRACTEYGAVLRAWEGARALPLPPAPGQVVVLGALPMDLANRFHLAVHVLLRTARPLTVYRFGMSGDGGAGGGWVPVRPRLLIDGLEPVHTAAAAPAPAAAARWQGCDACTEAVLGAGSLVYAGRTAHQAAYRPLRDRHGPTFLPGRDTLHFDPVDGASALHPVREYRAP